MSKIIVDEIDSLSGGNITVNKKIEGVEPTADQELATKKYVDDNSLNPINFYQKTDFINSSAGVVDAGKPVVLDSVGQLDSSMVSVDSSLVDHTLVQNRGTNTHTQIDNHIADTSNPHSVTANQTGAFATSEFVNSSSGVVDAGKPVVLNASGELDGSMVTVDSSMVDHTLIQNIGTNSHTQIDSHISSTANPHSVTSAQVGAYNTSEFIDTTTGAGDAGKPIKTDAVGLVDTSFLPAVEQNKVIVNSLEDFPAPIANVITLEDGIDYRISGVVNIGINEIVFGDNCGLTGDNPQNDILVYEGTSNMFTTTNNNLILIRLGISCDAGKLINASNIDYTIDPSLDPFQGRSKRFYIFNCNLIGGVAGNGSNIGEVEGFGTINFNSNLVRGWDSGLQVSNGLSFEGLNNKVVLWNGQGTTMITFRDNNWSGQTGGAGSYIPTGINALNFNGNTLHPRTIDYAISIEEGSSARSANIAGNIFISTGITTGGIFNPNSLSYNDLPTYNIQGNQGIADNSPKIQITIDNFTGATTSLAVGIPTKLNFNNTVKTSKNLLFSSRILVTSAANFEVGQIITGGTSIYTAKIQSIDLINNYIYAAYVQDGAGDNQYFTIGETITSLTASTTYNGVDGTLKYYGEKTISSRILSTLTLVKSQAGADVFRLILRINGINDDMTSSYIELDSGTALQIVLQALEDLEKDDIIEIYIENTGSGDDVVCESIVWNVTSS